MERYIHYQNAKIVYTKVGEGETVVLLHGFGEDSSIWDGQLLALKKKFELIIPDLPGSGKSDLIVKDGVTLKDYANCLYAILKNESIEQCILLGHSLGGYITLTFASIYGSMLSGFGLIHSTAFADTEEKKETRKKGIKFIEENGAGLFLKSTIANLYSSISKIAKSDSIIRQIEKGFDFSKEALIQYYNTMINRLDTTEVLKKASVPVLFIIGTEDIPAPMVDVLKQVHLPEIAIVHIMTGVGHMSMIEFPENLNKFLSNFCSKVSQIRS